MTTKYFTTKTVIVFREDENGKKRQVSLEPGKLHKISAQEEKDIRAADATALRKPIDESLLDDDGNGADFEAEVASEDGAEADAEKAPPKPAGKKKPAATDDL